MPKTLYDKLWQNPVVPVEPDGAALVCIDFHLVREAASILKGCHA